MIQLNGCYSALLEVCGMLTSFSFLFTSFTSLCVYAGLFGFSISSYICLTSVILVDLLGLEKLTNAFGLLLLFQVHTYDNKNKIYDKMIMMIFMTSL